MNPNLRSSGANSYSHQFEGACKKSLGFKIFAKFVVTGIVVTIVAYCLYLIAFFFVGSDFLSVLVSYLLAIPLSFHLNCRFVFSRQYTLRTFLLFALVQLSAMILNYLIIRELNFFWPRYLSALISYGVVPIIVFILSKLVIFKK